MNTNTIAAWSAIKASHGLPGISRALQLINRAKDTATIINLSHCDNPLSKCGLHASARAIQQLGIGEIKIFQAQTDADVHCLDLFLRGLVSADKSVLAQNLARAVSTKIIALRQKKYPDKKISLREVKSEMERLGVTFTLQRHDDNTLAMKNLFHSLGRDSSWLKKQDSFKYQLTFSGSQYELAILRRESNPGASFCMLELSPEDFIISGIFSQAIQGWQVKLRLEQDPKIAVWLRHAGYNPPEKASMAEMFYASVLGRRCLVCVVSPELKAHTKWDTQANLVKLLSAAEDPRLKTSLLLDLGMARWEGC